MNGYIRLIDWISEWSGRLVSFLVLPLIATIVYSVIIRYYFGGAVHWAFEMSLFFYGVLIMLGGAYTLKHQAHVRVDVLSHYLGPRGRCALDILSFLIIVAVCCVIVWLSARSAWVSTLRLERSALQTPFNPQIWWYKWMIPLSATLIGLQALAEIAKVLRLFRSEAQE
ncbi:TRAP transporter small permease subunit [Pararhodobacter sp. SW119]|uniref:TRAP transporter small permease subunit n=1 Tax=Pararhodobacter sp. SW119 TaxID=2780075 RepID=UPI001ADF14CE|nr:TRAP transporter small permease subunit [Pararhodobacter sp. SW119]